MDNVLGDWLSRSTLSVDHEEAPLMEEYVVNEVRKRLDGSSFEYDPEMKKVLRTIVENDLKNERKRSIKTTSEHGTTSLLRMDSFSRVESDSFQQ